LQENQPYDETDLVLRITAGDEQAFTRLFNNYQQKVFAFAMHFLKSETLSKEVVLDVFLGIWKRRSHLQSIEKLEAFLYISARNRSFTLLKKEAMEDIVRRKGSLYSALPVTGPEEALQVKEIDAFLSEAVNKLPDQQKRVYMMSRMEGLSHLEISKQLNISINTVNVHITQALRSIRNYLSSRLPAVLILLLMDIWQKK
jgi:RNA polymerase sigma-70 factor (family 1)